MTRAADEPRTDGPLLNRVGTIKSCQPKTDYIYFGWNTVINESDEPFVLDAVTFDKTDGIVIDGAWAVPTGRNLMGTAKNSRHLNSNPGWRWKERLPIPGAEIPAHSGRYDLTLRISSTKPTGRAHGISVHYHQGSQRYMTRTDRQWVLTTDRRCPKDWNEPF